MTTHDDIEYARLVLDRIGQRVYAWNGTTIRADEQIALHHYVPVHWLGQWNMGDKRIDKKDFATLKSDFDKGVAKVVAFALTGSIK